MLGSMFWKNRNALFYFLNNKRLIIFIFRASKKQKVIKKGEEKIACVIKNSLAFIFFKREFCLLKTSFYSASFFIKS